MVIVGAGAGGGGGAVTVTRALASAVPPGPVAVIVYVVDSVGETPTVPSGATVPTPESIVSAVAFVEDQVSVEDCPD
jgi:hypothetical protein